MNLKYDDQNTHTHVPPNNLLIEQPLQNQIHFSFQDKKNSKHLETSFKTLEYLCMNNTQHWRKRRYSSKGVGHNTLEKEKNIDV